ncbi:hypothetical protein M378DRAFT_166193 [Amanita muscaria Koide BX008]|uniref:Uncharacterized protein n=1 Tax=Amanita muscaria (strain Koide BX008) TaxID=946122 RepID=A0A0C2SG39_AMAMK|nr:hypothetical protein M378DRAFT_166193 [Amanita muscaria Koide BX008]
MRLVILYLMSLLLMPALVASRQRDTPREGDSWLWIPHPIPPGQAPPPRTGSTPPQTPPRGNSPVTWDRGLNTGWGPPGGEPRRSHRRR